MTLVCVDETGNFRVQVAKSQISSVLYAICYVNKLDLYRDLLTTPRKFLNRIRILWTVGNSFRYPIATISGIQIEQFIFNSYVYCTNTKPTYASNLFSIAFQFITLQIALK